MPRWSRLDPATGAIRTMVGSPDYFDVATSGAVNAALAQRQPGSAIKPLTFALALDPQAAAKAGRTPWTAATIIPDIRTSFVTSEGKPYVPNNYDRRYHGPVTLRTALANSYNIPAVRTLDAVGVEKLIDLARGFGIPWQRDIAAGEGQAARYGLSLTLGGGEVRLIDLAGAYAIFANGGHHVEPYAIERVTTLDGEEIWSHETGASGGNPDRAPAPPRMLDERVAFLITDILSDDVARQPAFGQGSALNIGRPAAAKTGTTTDWRDNWTVGYTPEVVTGVWVGNADNTPMKNVSGITGAAPIWHDFMTTVLRTQPSADFTVPNGVIELEICADSGLLPGEISSAEQQVPCPQRRREWFIEGTEPTRIDLEHLSVLVDPQTGQAAGPKTLAAQPQVFWELGPEYQAWARENNFPQPPTNLAREDSAQTAGQPGDSGTPLRLVSPDPNRLLRIDPGLPRSAQQIPVSALPTFDPVDGVTLSVNGQTLAVVAGPEYTAWWTLAAGRYVFGAWAERGDGSVVRSPDVVVLVE